MRRLRRVTRPRSPHRGPVAASQQPPSTASRTSPKPRSQTCTWLDGTIFRRSGTPGRRTQHAMPEPALGMPELALAIPASSTVPASQHFRGKSRDTGMLRWASGRARQALSVGPAWRERVRKMGVLAEPRWCRQTHVSPRVSAANPGTPACSIGTAVESQHAARPHHPPNIGRKRTFLLRQEGTFPLRRDKSGPTDDFVRHLAPDLADKLVGLGSGCPKASCATQLPCTPTKSIGFSNVEGR